MRQVLFDFRRCLLPFIAIWLVLSWSGATRAEGMAPFTDSPLARAAAQLRPGEFKAFETGLPTGVAHLSQLLRGSRPDGSGAPAIDTWTDSGQWDPKRKRAFFQGLRQSNRFLTYDAIGNAWHEISLDGKNAPPRFERFGHLYGRTALDWKRGHFYRLAGSTLHRYVIDEDRWEKVENCPITGYISIDWHYGLDMLVGVSKREIHGFRDGRWTFLGRASVHGYHSSAKYNPQRHDMLFIGGNHSRSTVDLLTADGEIKHMRDAPFQFSISADNLAHDPETGHYLVLRRDRKLWEYDPDTDQWRVARDMNVSKEDWPFAPGGIVPFVIDELGVIMWNQGRGPILHRHASAFSASADRQAHAPSKHSTRHPAAAAAQPAPPPAARKTRTADSAARPTTDRQSPVVGAHLAEDSIIEREARTVRPGEWRNIAHLTTWPGKEDGRSFKAFQYVTGIGGAAGGADGMGWTQNLVYHKGKLMILLMRDHLERALMVMEPDGRFWRINQPEGFDQKKHRRPFNKLTQDDKYLYYSPNIGRENLGRMIRTPLDNPGVFESYGIPIGDSDLKGQFAATYVPEWGRFYAYTPGGKIWSWAEGEPAWTRHGEMPRDEKGYRLSGYAGLLLWNPVRKELIVTGGQHFGRNPSTSHKVYRISEPLGPIEMLEDRRYPDGRLMPWGSGSSKLIADPRDGSYLVYRGGVFYRNHCAGGTFQVYDDIRESLPFGRFEPYAPLAVVPGTHVIVFISHIKGVVLHRLKPLAGNAGRQECRARSAPGTTASPPPTPPTSSVQDAPEQATVPGSSHSPGHRRPPVETRTNLEPRSSALAKQSERETRSKPAAAPELSPPTDAAVAPARSARTLTSSDVRALRAIEN